jgi:hypothetical protein
MFAESWLNLLREKVRQDRAEQEYVAKFGPPQPRVFVPWHIVTAPPLIETQRISEADDPPETAMPNPWPPS